MYGGDNGKRLDIDGGPISLSSTGFLIRLRIGKEDGKGHGSRLADLSPKVSKILAYHLLLLAEKMESK